jgi:hypothetical protein
VTKPQLDLRTDTHRLTAVHNDLENTKKFTASPPRPYFFAPNPHVIDGLGDR